MVNVNLLIVDWLGRGGIAQTTASVREVVPARVVTVTGRELVGDDVVGVAATGNRLVRHWALARRAADEIRRTRPATVMVQNYVAPPLEWCVAAAAAEVGAKLVVAVHDHRLHSPLAGTTLGLRRMIDAADTVIVHSSYVADRLVGGSHRDVRVMPLPMPRALRDDTGSSLFPAAENTPLALQFGVLKRRYKNGDLLRQLAERGLPNWQLAAVGVGAPQGVAGVWSVAGFVDAADLAATVAASATVLCPYRTATQSGVVTLAHTWGVPPIVTAVGGLPEQVEHGVDGLVVPPAATADDWRCAIESLSDSAVRERLRQGARDRALRDRSAFEEGVRASLAA